MTSRIRRHLLSALLVLPMAACAPTLNWREVRPEGAGAQLLFPCRPDAAERRVALAGDAVKLTLLSCAAGDHTWGFAFADMSDPTRVDAALAALQTSAAANLGAGRTDVVPQTVPGATPQARAGRSRLAGRSPEGKPLNMQMLVFARGTWVFQASALGETAAEEAVENFLTSIRFPP
jgi:hypothetical protein